MSTTFFRLDFVGASNPELNHTEFGYSSYERPLATVRGRNSGALQGYGTFQWTRAVKAITILLLNAKADSLDNEVVRPCATLVGSSGSLAASLDYALYKQPMWLLDMFGVDSHGHPLARKLFLRNNPGQKRPGPTAVALNPKALPAPAISISWENRILNSTEEIRKLLLNLEEENLEPVEYIPFIESAAA